MSLSPAQERVLADFQLSMAHAHASPVERKALVEAGIVESNLQNLHHGDADSLGSLQERTSIYGRAHALSPTSSADRFLADARKLKHPGISAGQLAQLVQRSAFPDRYAQHAGEAESLLGGKSYSLPRAGHNATAPQFVPSSSSTDTNAALLDSLMAGKRGRQGRGLMADLMQRLDSGSYTTASPAHTVAGSPSSGATVTPSHKGLKIMELFWQGQNGLDIKNGKKVPQGFVSGHTDHVHVAVPKSQIDRVAALAKRYGLHVGENPKYGGVHPVHAQGSYHYKGEAVDVSGDPTHEAAFAHAVAHLRG